MVEGMFKVDTVSRDGKPTTFAGALEAGRWAGALDNVGGKILH